MAGAILLRCPLANAPIVSSVFGSAEACDACFALQEAGAPSLAVFAFLRLILFNPLVGVNLDASGEYGEKRQNVQLWDRNKLQKMESSCSMDSAAMRKERSATQATKQSFVL